MTLTQWKSTDYNTIIATQKSSAAGLVGGNGVHYSIHQRG
jgi:hypothetical protein